MCETPHSVEWRTLSSSAANNASQRDVFKPFPRAAVCLLGVAKFVEWSAGSIKLHLLEKLNVSHDLYTFVSGSGADVAAAARRQVCEEFHEVEASHSPPLTSSAEIPLDRQFLLKAAAPTRDWDVLIDFLNRAVAGRVDYDERPMDYLRRSNVWERALHRPGSWLGRVQSPTGRLRHAAGLLQLRSFQWCADSVKRHEEAVLTHRYDFVVYARWDMNWLMPFPGIPMLSSLSPGSVWLPATQSVNFANDRFALVPRKHMSPYFEGWQLLVSGEAEDVFAKILPRSGVPHAHAEPCNTECFLDLRLRHAKVPVVEMPPLAWVQCVPGIAVADTRVNTACTPFSMLITDLSDILSKIFVGVKYGNELIAVLVAEQSLQDTERLVFSHHEVGEVPQLQRIVNRNFNAWTPNGVLKAARATLISETNSLQEEGMCTRIVVGGLIRWSSPGSQSCLWFLRKVLSLGNYGHALELARAAVIAAPLHIKNWFWLAGLLLYGPEPIYRPYAGLAALREAARLNDTHPLVIRYQHEFRPFNAEALRNALGGQNSTNMLQRLLVRCRRILALRRELQRACAAHDTLTPRGLSAWLRFGQFFLRSGWLIAAVGVLAHLESVYLHDGRPEFVRQHPPNAVTQIENLKSQLHKNIDDTLDANSIGVSLGLFRARAPSSSQLLDPEWLEQLEMLTLEGGRDLKAPEANHFSVVWDEMRLTNVFGGVV